MNAIPTIKVKKIANKNSCMFWCPYCNTYHYHGGKTLGHRLAHCTNENSPYLKGGYILVK